MEREREKEREREREGSQFEGTDPELTKREKPKKGWPPTHSAVAHLVEHRVPRISFDVRAIIFVEALSGTTIASLDF